mmetsp:Transcript_66583/g.210522  ORF Transcript_66583/g.210522 Transcript_66583/m.210522 type:complete len:423 (+) Transcript_66583:1308-2576(+)
MVEPDGLIVWLCVDALLHPLQLLLHVHRRRACEPLLSALAWGCLLQQGPQVPGGVVRKVPVDELRTQLQVKLNQAADRGGWSRRGGWSLRRATPSCGCLGTGAGVRAGAGAGLAGNRNACFGSSGGARASAAVCARLSDRSSHLGAGTRLRAGLHCQPCTCWPPRLRTARRVRPSRGPGASGSIAATSGSVGVWGRNGNGPAYTGRSLVAPAAGLGAGRWGLGASRRRLCAGRRRNRPHLQQAPHKAEDVGAVVPAVEVALVDVEQVPAEAKLRIQQRLRFVRSRSAEAKEPLDNPAPVEPDRVDLLRLPKGALQQLHLRLQEPPEVSIRLAALQDLAPVAPQRRELRVELQRLGGHVQRLLAVDFGLPLPQELGEERPGGADLLPLLLLLLRAELHNILLSATVHGCGAPRRWGGAAVRAP